MTWLLARAYATSVMTGGKPELLQGVEHLQEALIVSTDHDKRFWALQEIVARLGSMGSGPQAESLIAQYEGEFNSPEEQATIAAWRQRVSSLQQQQEQVRERRDREQRQRQQAEHIAALRRRLEAANARGDTERAAQYSQLIQEFSDQPLE